MSGVVKVRIGFGFGTRGMRGDDAAFGDVVDALEDLGFDSLWLSERVAHDGPDPLVGLAFAAARTRRLKVGTSVQVLPGRSPALLAKQWASLDQLSGGRALPAFGLGVRDPGEQQAFGVERRERARRFDEALPLMRRFWAEDAVTHDGRWYRYDDVRVRPHPVQQPLEVWLGGRAEPELRRCGRLGDGWLPSFATPDDAAAGWRVVSDAAAEHGRELDPGHFGALVPYVRTGLPEEVREAFGARFPDRDPAAVIPVGLGALAEAIGAFVEVGASKFVAVPLEAPGDPSGWPAELEDLAAAVLPLQT